MSRTPPPWSIGLILPLVLVFSAMTSIAWYNWTATLGMPRDLADKASFLFVEVFGILLPALGLAQLFKVEPEATFPVKRTGFGPSLGVLGATLGLSIGLTYLQEVYQKAFNLPYPEQLMQVLTIHTPLEGVLIAVGVVLAAAVCEEAVFRGYCQSSLQARLGGWESIALTALLFAAFHLEPAGLPTYLLLGAWLGWLRYAGGTLWLPILAHGANNLLALIQVNVLGDAFWLAHGAIILPLSLLLMLGSGYAVWRGLR